MPTYLKPFNQTPNSRKLRTYCGWPGDIMDGLAAPGAIRATVWSGLPTAWLLCADPWFAFWNLGHTIATRLEFQADTEAAKLKSVLHVRSWVEEEVAGG